MAAADVATPKMVWLTVPPRRLATELVRNVPALPSTSTSGGSLIYFTWFYISWIFKWLHRRTWVEPDMVSKSWHWKSFEGLMRSWNSPRFGVFFPAWWRMFQSIHRAYIYIYTYFYILHTYNIIYIIYVHIYYYIHIFHHIILWGISENSLPTKYFKPVCLQSHPRQATSLLLNAFDLNPNCGHTSKGPIFHPAIFFIPGTLIGKHLLWWV